MKISNSEGRPLSGLGRSSGPTQAGGGGRSPSVGGPTPGADRVQLSSLSAHLAQALGSSAAHLNKLSALAGAVLSGGYQVDAGAVSDSIIRHSLQFGGANYL